jgi:N-glycosylase/DNA lyase
MRTYEVCGQDIIISCPGFDLELTFECGQAFRRPLRCAQDRESGRVTLFNVSEAEFLEKWDGYFDFKRDYEAIKQGFVSDPLIGKAMKRFGGIRILRQESFEALVSFIISQNNNIPRIKLIIGRLTEHFGRFPTSADLAEETPETLSFARAGFRAKYLCGSARMIADGDVSLERIAAMPLPEARSELQKLPGVGPKVAECTLLYGMGKFACFPVDVWIKRALNEHYPDGFPFLDHPYAGIAQQFLFHYIRQKDVEHFTKTPEVVTA